ncbi:MAG: GerAB/ArcD/ProY family transporter [Lachnospiraceae bacterium]|nr:GerAB/ArcD/ProY family transporter [Lachnospiraceae bacterium]
MYTQNNMISVRQCFRTGILENITLGMVVIPYVAVNLAGKWHFPAMLIGLLMGGVYMAVMYALSKSVTKDTLENLKNLKGVGGAIGILYSIRFLIRIGIVLYFFGKTMQEYLLQSYNLWVIIIAFVLVCGYGAARDIEKRGRMLELLFPWMVVPIILVAVFAISNINLDELLEGLRGVNYENIRGEAGFLDVLKAGYVCFLVMSTSELLLFTMPYQKENSWRNALKLGLWILISIFLAYIFIIGILGGHWVASDSQAALNVKRQPLFREVS